MHDELDAMPPVLHSAVIVGDRTLVAMSFTKNEPCKPLLWRGAGGSIKEFVESFY